MSQNCVQQTLMQNN